MAIKGAWLAQQFGEIPYGSARKQGAGINQIHAVRGGPGRGIATHPTLGTIPEAMTDGFAVESGYQYCEEDSASVLWGYGVDTGTADRPALDTSEIDTRSTTGTEWPQWGPVQEGLPGGAIARSFDHGADASNTPKSTPEESVLQGWVNKDDSSWEEDAQPSDPSQYEMQTSMVQRNKVRAGSQISGTDSDYSAPVQSRVRAMKAKTFVGRDSARHSDMTPKSQDYILRPFWMRTAGVGYVDWMKTNAMYSSDPLTRVAPPDPHQGPEIGADVSRGWTDEDVIPYV